MDPISLALLAAKAIPMITGWIAGDDAEEKAGKIVGTIETVTGLKGQSAVDAMAADPTLIAKAQDQILEEIRIYAKDRADARSRDIELRKMNGGKNERANFMLAAAFASLVIIMALMWSQPNMPGVIIGIFSTAVGAILKMLSDGFQFEFGSSRGSKDKTQLMGQSK